MIPLWLSIFGLVLGGVGALGATAAILCSRYREQAFLEQKQYIAALEARRDFLEETTKRQATEQQELKAKMLLLEGKVATLQDMILRQCRHAEIDPVTGGCRNCALGMAYGQGGRQ